MYILMVLKEGMGRTTCNKRKLLMLDTGIYTDITQYLKEEGKNPFTLDSKEPTESFRDFLMGQVRYSAIAKQFPDIAEELFNMAEKMLKKDMKAIRD